MISIYKNITLTIISYHNDLNYFVYYLKDWHDFDSIYKAGFCIYWLENSYLSIFLIFIQFLFILLKLLDFLFIF